MCSGAGDMTSGGGGKREREKSTPLDSVHLPFNMVCLVPYLLSSSSSLTGYLLVKTRTLRRRETNAFAGALQGVARLLQARRAREGQSVLEYY